MTKRMVLMLVLAGALFGAIFGWKAFVAHMTTKFLSSQGVPPQTVSTAQAGYAEWQSAVSAVGTLRAVHGADLAPQVVGVVSAIHFSSGQEVKTGAPLVQLDNASDLALLESLKATEQLAETTYQRDLQQRKANFISQAALDNDAANLRVAKARVAEQQAVVDKKLVRAPFDGRLGVRVVDLGQYVAAGTKLVTLQSLDPILADFSVPQNQAGQVVPGQKVVLTSDALPGERFEGSVEAIDSKIDPATRNVLVRASLSNPGHKLLPGMYAKIEISLATAQRHLTLPQTAITFNPYGDTVFVVEAQGKGPDGKPRQVASQRFVTVGPKRGDQIAVLSGLKEGETVVTAGQLKLRNGTPVVVNNTVQPSDQAAPRPKDE
ncbi:MAG TPA: efflux RND transporter periplasmic adaptor subunit [Burkholderiales bacterium]|nr:efflux RND transporter periplasmic adaptor subunit [Burkholderiales bacterium]